MCLCSSLLPIAFIDDALPETLRLCVYVCITFLVVALRGLVVAGLKLQWFDVHDVDSGAKAASHYLQLSVGSVGASTSPYLLLVSARSLYQLVRPPPPSFSNTASCGRPSIQ